jgi:beta-N-acetylhexosaminidase
VHDMLRTQLHFDGVIVTDWLGAGALAPLNKTPAQIGVMAINAGNDMLLPLALGTPPTTNLDGAYNGIIQAVQSGQIPESRIDESVRRVLHLKWWLGLVQHPYRDPSAVSRVVGTEPHQELAEQTARDSMTLVKNDHGVLPLDAKKVKSAFVTGWDEPTLPSVDIVANQVALKGPHVSALATGTTPTAPQIAQATAMAKGNDVTVVLTYNVWNPTQFNSGQTQLVNALAQTGKPVIVIAQGAPYDIAYMQGATAFLDAWSYQTLALQTATDTLFGAVSPTGTLPVTVSQPPPSPQVLYPFGFGLHYR